MESTEQQQDHNWGRDSSDNEEEEQKVNGFEVDDGEISEKEDEPEQGRSV